MAKASVALVRGLGGQNPSVCEFLHHSHWWRESCRSAVCVGGVRFLLTLRRFEKLLECSKKFADRRHPPATPITVEGVVVVVARGGWLSPNSLSPAKEQRPHFF